MNHLDERDLLARALRERAGDVSGQPVSFQAVRGSARRLQRRRTMVTGAVAAAVATVALPTGIAVTAALNDVSDNQRPITADTPTPTPGATPRGTVPLRLDGVERGEDPRIGYLEDDLLVLPDGRELGLPKVYSEIAPTGDGWVALASREGEYVRDLIDADGSVLSSLPSGWGLATNLDGSRVAFTQVENGQWNVFDVVVDLMDARSPYNRENERVQAVGYAGDGVLVYNVGDGEDVEVRVFEPSAEDYEVPAEPGFLAATAASEATGMVAGQTESRDDGSCWAVVRHDTGAPAFETCDHSLGQFSSDGRHLIGTDSYGDGLGPRTLALLDATTGEAVVSFERPADEILTLGDMAWEDDEHVLATVTVGLESHTVRFGLDGSMELASDTYAAEEYDVLSPVRFVARP